MCVMWKTGRDFAPFLLGMKLDVSFCVLSSIILHLCFLILVVSRQYICTVSVLMILTTELWICTVYFQKDLA